LGRVELSTAMFDWIEAFYNRTRRHSSLGMLSPIAYETLHAQQTSAA
jgi:transposase InsO family protein